MEEITEVLNIAVLKRKTVRIQKEERDSEGYYPDDIIVEIRGHDEIQELDKWS